MAAAATPTAESSDGQIQVRIAEPDGSCETHFKISMKRTLERMFIVWTERRNTTKGTNSSFEFSWNGKVLSVTDTAEGCGLTKLGLITATEILKTDVTMPLPHKWPFKADPDFTYYQELVRMKPSQYVCPLMPFPLFDPANVFPVQFGPENQTANFLIDSSLTYLNHGSYGATPQVVLQAQHKWQNFMESNCCRFFGYQYSAFMAHAVRTMAGFVGANPQDIVFVDNATTGVLTVVQSLKLQPTDSILYTSLGYGPISNYLKNMDVERIVVDIPLPLKLENFAELVLAAVKPNTRTVILDHITSSTGAILPIESVISKLQQKGIFVMIDGAHAVGQVPLNLNALGADAYTSNCHKWLFASKGCAFLYVNAKHHHMIHPVIYSTGVGLGLHAEFAWSGTRDYTPFLSVLTAIELYNHWGADRIRNYNHNLAVEAAEHLMAIWGTSTIFSDNPDDRDGWKKHVGAMVTLEVPGAQRDATWAFAMQLKRAMLIEKAIDMVCFPLNGKLYTRISAQVYLDKEDFVMFGEDLPKVVDLLILSNKANANPELLRAGSIAQPPLDDNH